MGDNRAYVCSGHRDGACANSIRVRRDAVETAVLNPLRDDLLAPERVARLAKELQQEYAERMRSMQARAVEVPKELDALDARIARLRDRLKNGDPDMTADEIQATIERAQSKRQELTGAQPSGRESARVFAMLPNTADLYRRQIALGLDGHPAEALKARTFLRSLLGDICLEPGEGGSLWAAYEMQPGALIRAAVTCGRGDRI
jgi:site-specific DNA recombinase